MYSKKTTLSLIFQTGLHGIELSGNPWNCDCRLRPLQEWLLSANVPYTLEPKCATPKRIGGRGFGQLGVDEFACAPEIISAPRFVEAKAGELVGSVFFSFNSLQNLVPWNISRLAVLERLRSIFEPDMSLSFM